VHNGGAMHFGIGGKLFVAVGDGGTAANAQSIANRFGKILRLDVNNPPTYIPVDNPTSIAGIAGTPVGPDRSIWAAGLRNPCTFAFKPGTNTMYINDAGASSFEEINVGGAGNNYGWNQTQGPFNPATFPDFTQPIVAYQHNGGTNNLPSSPTYTGSAIRGGAFYLPTTVTFPNAYVGDYFYADFESDWIKRYDPVSKTVSNFATNAGGPIDLRVGNDGALYYLSRGNSHVVRVAPPVPPPLPCAANAVNTGTSVDRVDVDDLLAVISGWGDCQPHQACPGNVVNTGTSLDRVDVDDLLAVINGWGPCP
jgi:glucose/arabinose dehydrogenase